MNRSSLALAISQLLAMPMTFAATIPVDTLVPEVNAGDGLCSITEAVLNANGDDQSGSNDCPAGSGADLITLPAGTLTLTQGVLIAQQYVGLPEITGALSIEGAGSAQTLLQRDPGVPCTVDLTISPQEFRLISSQAPTLSLSNMTLANGCADATSASASRGGAVDVRGPTFLRIEDMILRDHMARAGGALSARSLEMRRSSLSGNSATVEGGAISMLSVTGNSLIEDSLFADNVAGIGGALSINTSTATVQLQRIDVLGNTATARGGGVLLGDAYGARVELLDSTISGNQVSSGPGGGLYISTLENYVPNEVLIEGSTISGNMAGGDGGGIGHSAGVASPGYAGFELTLRDSTISGNRAGGSGGGIALRNALTSSVRLEGSTITSNVADEAISDSGDGGGIHINNATAGGLLSLQGSVVAANSDYGSILQPDIGIASSASLVLDADNSLVGDNRGSGLTEAQTPDGNNNLIGNGSGGGVIDPLLGPLGDFGGLTQTHVPQPSSSLIDHWSGCTGLDQRDRSRGQDGDGTPSASECDIGAVEFFEEFIFADGFEDGPIVLRRTSR